MTEFVVVGAGPVGLYVACLLAGAGREVLVLDDGDSSSGSRSIGVHPPALEALELVGVAEELLAQGSRIANARLMLGSRRVGDLPLDGCPGPYPFVLSLPQHLTERSLRLRLESSPTGELRTRTRAVGIRRSCQGSEVLLDDGGSVDCLLVLGCDGRRSVVREAAGVRLAGTALEHHYAMADVPDDTALGCDAVIALCDQGVVESFPLPGRTRRWVARFSARPDGLTAGDLAHEVLRRTGIQVDAGDARASVFTAEKRIAERLVGDGWALAGDAAHVISPIGGQGMNIGLLGGRALVEALLNPQSGRALTRYDSTQRRRARAAARRAGLNMLLGSDHLPPGVRWAALHTVSLPGLQARFARYFTMRGL